jgi:uracil-DNA glycosylase
MLKTEKLELLQQKVCSCTKCPDLVASRTQTVFGEGNPNTRLVFLGEGPGKNEDQQGRPFVGKAGQLLDNIIQACGWKREDVFILNVVKCRPEHNRVPTPAEAANCRPFLDLQLKIIRPEIIVCLGATAAQNLLSTNISVTRLRGSWYDYINGDMKARVRVTLHPAYLLRNPKAKPDCWQDMQAVIEELKRGKEDESEKCVAING